VRLHLPPTPPCHPPDPALPPARLPPQTQPPRRPFFPAGPHLQRRQPAAVHALLRPRAEPDVPAMALSARQGAGRIRQGGRREGTVGAGPALCPGPVGRYTGRSPMAADDLAAGEGRERPTRARYGVLAFLCGLAFVPYIDRICISKAAPLIEAELGLSHTAMGFVFGAFTVAYGLFEVPTGRWGDRYGSRGVLTRIVLWWSACTALTGCVWPFTLDSGYPLPAAGGGGGGPPGGEGVRLPVPRPLSCR